MSEQLVKSDLTDDDMNELVYSLDTFESDSKECLQLINRLSSVVVEEENEINRDIETICERFEYLMDKWLTNSKLIECHLNQFLQTIVEIITNCPQNGHRFNACFQLIQSLVSCVGPKTLCRYFPTEVLWLTKLIDWCERQSPKDTNSWQTRSVLLLWLSMAVKTPFHLNKFDSNDESIDYKTIVDRIYDLIIKYLDLTDKSRDSAAILAANFFSRPDMIKQQLLSRFMDQILSSLGTTFGHVIAVALLFKTAHRLDINPFAVRVIESGNEIKCDTTVNPLINKWKIKLIGRSALTLMAPRVAKWRYRRGRRLLSQNLADIQISDEMQININSEKKPLDDIEDDIDYSDIPDQIEVIIGSLLDGLKDTNTIVRWSAAKYIARITNRLPKELASDVVSHIYQLFGRKGSDSRHGCCLALAELSRRGLILCEQFPQIIEVVEKALIFDEMKGSFSIGSNVRDAACYVCWSLSRAYDQEIIEPLVKKLAPTLVCVACFDREINCRRASSAAIQEFVGRTQVFPHGLEVMVLTDFHSLSNRSHCYSDIALKLAQKPEFAASLVEHLIVKCEHWDRDVREISAYSLGLFSTIIDMNPYLPQLLSKSISLDLIARHGSILSMAYVMENSGHNLKNEFIEQIQSIAGTLHEKKLLGGMGGEFMKEALSLLIGKSSLALIPIISPKDKVFDIWIEIICQSIVSKDIKTQSAAVSAVPTFCQNYLNSEPVLKNRVLSQLLIYLDSSNETARIGASEGLRLMSPEVLDFDYYMQCLHFLVKHITSGDVMCSSRASEVITLVVMSLKFKPIAERFQQFEPIRHKILDCFLMALNDRTKSSRGDIGGNVRLATIEAVLLFIDEIIDDNQIVVLLKLMSTQCVSIWEKERILAINGFKQIVFNRKISLIDGQYMKALFADEDEDWKPFIKLLSEDMFSFNLWKGLVKCVSNPTETKVRNILKKELKTMKSNVFKEFLKLYKNSSDDDLCLSCIQCSHFLLTSVKTDDHFRCELLGQTYECIRISKDCQKLISAVDVFGAGIQCGSYQQSAGYLMRYLCHPFPRVRSHTANQFYVSLLTVDDVNEEAINLLTETNWTQSLAQLRPIRGKMYAMLDIPAPSGSPSANTT